jgi:vitamin B12 transporter
MKKKMLIVAAAFFSSHSYAQQDSTTMDELVVTATKNAVKQSQTGKVVSVINQETLQRNAGKTLTEILNYQAGIFVSGANNALGSNQDYYIRGAATSNTLILLDGVPVADPSYINSYFDLNNINPTQVERIEILKGAQSTLWGSDAVAGVINIITKKGAKSSFSPNIQLSYGSYETFRANAGLNGSLKNFTYNLQYGYTNSKGFSSAKDTAGNKNFENDQFKQHNVQANLGYRINNKWSARYTANYGIYEAGLDAGAYRDDADFINKNSSFLNSVVLAYSTPKTSIQFVNTIIDTKRFLEDDSASVGGFNKFARARYDGSSFVSEIFGNTTLNKFLNLVAGVQRVGHNTSQNYNSISSFGPFIAIPISSDSAKTTNYAAYASLNVLGYKNFNVEAGLRYNNHSIYGNNVTWSFNPSYNIDEATRVFINLSSAYKVPSLYQLYSEYGNNQLKPETSTNYEIGIQSLSNNKRNSIRLVAFKRDIKDLIVFFTDANFNSQYINRDEQHDYGFEIENTIAIGKAGSWVSNFTYVEGEGKTNNVKANNLFRRPNFTFNSSLTLEPVKGLTVMPNIRFVGTRLRGDFDPGPQVMPAYYTIDFSAGYLIASKHRLFLDLRNITDQTFEDIPGYNSRGANVTLGITAQF